MSILSVTKGHCNECYACIRACPVKAIKVVDGQAEVIDERCIYCGRCVVACPNESIVMGDDLKKAFSILSSGRKVVAVLAPEFIASFYPMSVEQLGLLLERAGFCGYEDTVLGEELVAKHYLKYFASESNFPIIRSTCPAIVTWIEKYYPGLNKHLVPVVTPMDAQGSITKKFYGDDVAVIYATPCVAAKYEAKSRNAIDAVLTFKEFKHLLVMRVIDLGSDQLLKKVSKPEIRRRYSVAGGFPRPIIAQYNMLDSALMVERGVGNFDGFADAVSSGLLRAKYIDLLMCSGCIDGPGIDTHLKAYHRKRVVEQSYKDRLLLASEQITFDQLEPYLPEIDANKAFTSKKVDLFTPSEQTIREILAEAEKFSLDDELNCGACGYQTCRDLAIAIYQGIADWKLCFPFQRNVYDRLISSLQESAVTDGLTGLANHKNFLERLTIEFDRAKRYKSELSLIMIDVDTFKEINDTYGHVVGDSVLETIASVLKNNIRKSDLAARYGGDEFALILPETSLEKAYKVGEKLRRKVESDPIILEPDILIRTTLSIGVSSCIPDINDPLTLVQKADEALYAAKESGRNKTIASADLKVE